MSQPLDESYFQWLCDQVGALEAKDPSRTYWRLLKLLFTKEFVWVVANDGNRIEDGKELRYEFVDQSGLNDVDQHWMQLGCSMLELMIGLSRRLAFEAEGEPRDWFWTLAWNAGLVSHNDSHCNDRMVGDILDRIIWRTYHSNGRGGFFPLQRPPHDQRKVELWYQLNAYIIETT